MGAAIGVQFILTIRLMLRRDRGDLIGLEAELKRAVIVDSKEVPADVITMNSQADLYASGA